MRKFFRSLMLFALIVASVTISADAQEAWDGTSTDISWYSTTDDNIFEIETAAELAGLAELVNSGNTFSGKTIVLTEDIDLANKDWTPIGYMGKTFNGTFDGNDKVISNLNVSKELTNTSANNGVGLFGRTDSPAVIKNFTIDNATVKGSLYVAAVVGHGYTGSSISNVTVKGNIMIDAYWYAGAIGGYGYMNTVDDCHVNANEGSYIKGNNGSYIGGIWGFRGEGGMKTTGCTVSNIEISGVDRVGGITGQAHYGNTLTNNKIENVLIKATDTEATTVGLIAGACQGTESNPTKFENNTVVGSHAYIGTTETIGLYGTNISGKAPVTNYTAQVGTVGYETLDAALNAAKDGDIVLLNTDVKYTSTATITIDKAITLDLNGYTLTTNGTYGGISAKGNCSIINGTIVHNGTVAAIKLWNMKTIENVDIIVTPKPNKVIGGIVLQETTTTRLDSLKNTTITGATNGIETYNCGDATLPVIGEMENVTIVATERGLQLSAPLGTAKNCSITGDKVGIEMYRKGTYSVTLTLDNCSVNGDTAIYVHDEEYTLPEKNNSGEIKLIIDDKTKVSGRNGIEVNCGNLDKVTIVYNAAIGGGILVDDIDTDNEAGIYFELVNLPVDEKNTFRVELYAGETYLTYKEITLQSEGILGCTFYTVGTSSSWDQDEWTAKEELMPTHAVFFMDGVEIGSDEVEFTKEEWIAFPGTEHTTSIIGKEDATCTEKGYTGDEVCSICEEVVTKGQEIPALGHKETKIPAVAATCEKTGLTEGTKCSVCNEILKAQEVVKALGHKEVVEGAKEATCKEEGHTGNKVCEVCDKVLEEGKAIAKKAHTYKDGKCTVCGTEDPDYVQTTTGDRAPVMMFAGIAMLSMAAMVVLKKKELF